MNLTDTHCHLYFDNYQGDLEEVLERAGSAGVSRVLVPAIDLQSCRRVLELVERFDMLYGAVGVHPNSGNSWSDAALDALAGMARHPKIVALGEIGLDYYRDHTPRELQLEILHQQLNLAASCRLPVILHVRNAADEDRACITDLLDTLEAWVEDDRDSAGEGPGSRGVIHSFSGNVEESQRALSAGFLLGVTGPITYNNAGGLRDVVRQTDLGRLLVETDGPFLSPQQQRGKRNEPAHVRYIIDKISDVTGQPAARVAQQTTANASRLFLWE